MGSRDSKVGRRPQKQKRVNKDSVIRPNGFKVEWAGHMDNIKSNGKINENRKTPLKR
jgi:hypothetical protein